MYINWPTPLPRFPQYHHIIDAMIMHILQCSSNDTMPAWLTGRWFCLFHKSMMFLLLSSVNMMSVGRESCKFTEICGWKHGAGVQPSYVHRGVWLFVTWQNTYIVSSNGVLFPFRCPCTTKYNQDTTTVYHTCDNHRPSEMDLWNFANRIRSDGKSPRILDHFGSWIFPAGVKRWWPMHQIDTNACCCCRCWCICECAWLAAPALCLTLSPQWQCSCMLLLLVDIYVSWSVKVVPRLSWLLLTSTSLDSYLLHSTVTLLFVAVCSVVNSWHMHRCTVHCPLCVGNSGNIIIRYVNNATCSLPSSKLSVADWMITWQMSDMHTGGVGLWTVSCSHCARYRNVQTVQTFHW